MSTFDKDNLVLLSQGIGGTAKQWAYTDTGLLIADTNQIAGYFTTGYDMGMRQGDRVLITEGDTGTWRGKDPRLAGGRRQYTATVLQAADTGSTQITLGKAEMVGDTGTSSYDGST